MSDHDPATGEVYARMPSAIAQAIIAVKKQVRQIGQDERNEHGKYRYVSVDRFYERIGPMMAEAGIALLIAVVGVAGVLAFSVSARTREFGVRLAVGSTPRHLLVRVLSEGAAIAAIGIVAGVAGGYVFGRVAASYFENITLPGALPALAAAITLVAAAIVASLMPAARASRVDVLQALGSE